MGEWKRLLSMRNVWWRFRRKNKNRCMPEWAETLASLPPHVSWPLCIAICCVIVALPVVIWQICSTMENICSVLLRSQLAANFSGGGYPELITLAASAARMVFRATSRSLGW